MKNIPDGSSYLLNMISVAVEDRIPPLDCLGRCDGGEFDYIVAVNTTFMLKPYAIDPDEEPVKYIYTGWKADYDELKIINISKLLKL